MPGARNNTERLGRLDGLGAGGARAGLDMGSVGSPLGLQGAQKGLLEGRLEGLPNRAARESRSRAQEVAGASLTPSERLGPLYRARALAAAARASEEPRCRARRARFPAVASPASYEPRRRVRDDAVAALTSFERRGGLGRDRELAAAARASWRPRCRARCARSLAVAARAASWRRCRRRSLLGAAWASYEPRRRSDWSPVRHGRCRGRCRRRCGVPGAARASWKPSRPPPARSRGRGCGLGVVRASPPPPIDLRSISGAARASQRPLPPPIWPSGRGAGVVEAVAAAAVASLVNIGARESGSRSLPELSACDF